MIKIFLLLVTFLFVYNADAGSWVRVEPYALSGAIQNFELESVCTEGGYTCQNIDDTSVIKYDPQSKAIVIDAVKQAAQDAANAELARKAASRDARLARIRDLARKVKAGTITAAERNEALGLLLKDYIRELEELD